jgi:hypothetical protein
VKGREHLEDVCAGKMLLEEIRWDVVDSDSCGSGYGYCEHGDKLSGFVKDGEFLD